MVSRKLVLAAALSIVATTVGLGHPGQAGAIAAAALPAEETSESEGPELLGPLLREEIEAAVPDWVEAEVEAQVDPEAAALLPSALESAEVMVLLGTWCSDSRRELARLWRALDEAGVDDPRQLRYVGVDRAKKEPSELLAGHDLLYVPTFIVRRDGREIGRIVEESPAGIERDLLALLTGEKRGLITASTELLEEGVEEREE